MGNSLACGDGTGIKAKFKSIRYNRKPLHEKARRSAGATLMEPYAVDWTKAAPEKWGFHEKRFNSFTYIRTPVLEEYAAPISEGKQKLEAYPEKYVGLKFQADMLEWPEELQKYTLVLRTGCGFKPTLVPNGHWMYIQAVYQVLEHHETMQFTDEHKDEYTDSLTYQGRALAPALHPGRGHGCVDLPHIKIIGDIHPNDVAQGTVGDCWLLSAISAMSEFDGAIKALFSKTPDIDALPKSDPNKYVITLYDVKTWQPKEYVIDERLCATSDGSRLLGCEPSVDGELWACYLEKAIAIHCGGWDQLDGGHCTHAWRILTGCKYQYTFMNQGAGWDCLGTMNPNTGEWEELGNSPKEGFQGLWPMEWPAVGGGGELATTIDDEDMFNKICAWDDANYIIACGTKAGSDTENTDGVIDGHAYTILTAINNAGDTEFDMLRVRNPWGHFEFKSVMWADDGPGWEQYPTVKEACRPVVADDGVFWMDKAEFFRYFKTIYVCAADMTKFIEGAPTF